MHSSAPRRLLLLLPLVVVAGIGRAGEAVTLRVSVHDRFRMQFLKQRLTYQPLTEPWERFLARCAGRLLQPERAGARLVIEESGVPATAHTVSNGMVLGFQDEAYHSGLRTTPGVSSQGAEAARLRAEAEVLGHKVNWDPSRLGAAEKVLKRALALDPESAAGWADMGTLKHWQQQDSDAPKSTRCSQPGSSPVWAMAEGQRPAHDALRELHVFEAVADGSGVLEMVGFARGHEVQVYGNHAVMSPKVLQRITEADLRCHFGAPDSEFVSPVEIQLDMPYKLRMRCKFSAELASEPSGWISVRLQPAGNSSRPLEFRLERQPPVREKTIVGLCTAPLFLGNALPGTRVLEWLEYHRIIGVSGFHVYDRHSALASVLAPLGAHTLLSVQPWALFEPSVERTHVYYDQQLAQDACLLRHRHQHEWLLFLDPDEFINILGGNHSIQAAIKEAERSDPSVAQLMLHNVIYGGAARPGSSLLVDRFRLRADRSVPWRQKPLVHAASTRSLWAHFASRLRCGRTDKLHPSLARVNHYMSATGRTLQDPPPTVEDSSATWVVQELQARLKMYHQSRF